MGKIRQTKKINVIELGPGDGSLMKYYWMYFISFLNLMLLKGFLYEKSTFLKISKNFSLKIKMSNGLIILATLRKGR